MQFFQGLQRALQQRPDSIATICEGRVRTFRQTTDRVSRLADGLRALGIAKGDRVAILSLNSDHYLESYLAIAWLGAVCVPANYRWATSEIAYSLVDAGCVAMIVDRHHADRIDDLRANCPGLAHVIQTEGAILAQGAVAFEALIDGSAGMNAINAQGGDLLGIFYTGGTTGAPKGVMLSHRNLCSSGLSMLAEGAFGEGAVGLHVAPMFHLADMMMTTCLLLRGGTHVFLAQFAPDSVLAAIAACGVTDMLVVPAMLQMIVDHPTLRAHDTSSLRSLLYGASPASESLISRTLAAFPDVRLTQGYGMTESAAFITALPWHQHRPDGPHPERLRAAGRATFDVLVRIVDGSGNDVGRGEIGEIIARGPNVMIGYLNKPDATAEALRGGWLHTGDVGYMDDEGYVFIVDRAKDMIISGGENIYSAEVENAVASHPAVATCAVIGIPHESMGEAVHAVIVTRAGAHLSLDELQTHCRTFIAGYKLPRSLEIREALPLSGAGKILKTELRKPFWADLSRAVG